MKPKHLTPEDRGYRNAGWGREIRWQCTECGCGASKIVKIGHRRNCSIGRGVIPRAQAAPTEWRPGQPQQPGKYVDFTGGGAGNATVSITYTGPALPPKPPKVWWWEKYDWKLRPFFIKGFMPPGIAYEGGIGSHQLLLTFFLIAFSLEWERKDRPQP
jgi:hypothetical protein